MEKHARHRMRWVDEAARVSIVAAVLLLFFAGCSTDSTERSGDSATRTDSENADEISSDDDGLGFGTPALFATASTSDSEVTQSAVGLASPDESRSGSGISPTAPPPPRVNPGPALTPTPFTPADGLNIDLVLAGSGFVEPVDMANPTDSIETIDNLWIVEQVGTVRRLTDGRPGEPPVLDIRDRVEDGANEQGLLGIALHPGYFLNGRVFVNYTAEDDATVVSEFFVPHDQDRHGPRIDPSTEQIILRIPQPARNHNGGQIAFGPDGYLYIGMGDGGGANDTHGNAQNPESLLGKMLRIDIDKNTDVGGEPYRIPPDNPFVDSTSFRPEIWAWGLRNPWRFSFATGGDQMDGLYIGDVGQGSWEEINWVPREGGGANFGWPILEGTHCFVSPGDRCDNDGATLSPIVEYPQGGGNGCSVTGGVVVRDSGSPIYGAYIFADYCSGRMWIAGRNGDGGWSSQVVADTGLNISAFGTDGFGYVYLLAHSSGEVHRIVATVDE